LQIVAHCSPHLLPLHISKVTEAARDLIKI